MDIKVLARSGRLKNTQLVEVSMSRKFCCCCLTFFQQGVVEHHHENIIIRHAYQSVSNKWRIEKFSTGRVFHESKILCCCLTFFQHGVVDVVLNILVSCGSCKQFLLRSLSRAVVVVRLKANMKMVEGDTAVKVLLCRG